VGAVLVLVQVLKVLTRGDNAQPRKVSGRVNESG
jgi:hypothetical protein